MRICMIATTLPLAVGGLETHVRGLSRALLAAEHALGLLGTAASWRPGDDRARSRLQKLKGKLQPT